MTPTKVLINVLFKFNRAEVLVILNAGQSCLLIKHPFMAGHAWLVPQIVALSVTVLSSNHWFHLLIYKFTPEIRYTPSEVVFLFVPIYHSESKDLTDVYFMVCCDIA